MGKSQEQSAPATYSTSTALCAPVTYSSSTSPPSPAPIDLSVNTTSRGHAFHPSAAVDRLTSSTRAMSRLFHSPPPPPGLNGKHPSVMRVCEKGFVCHPSPVAAVLPQVQPTRGGTPMTLGRASEVEPSRRDGVGAVVRNTRGTSENAGGARSSTTRTWDVECSCDWVYGVECQSR